MAGEQMKKLLLTTLLFGLTASAESLDIRTLVQQAKPALVQIAAFDKEGKLLGTGTGFFVSADGYLVTNYHVVDGASSILPEITEDRLPRLSL
jgi:S1-C subfamily serine protease